MTGFRKPPGAVTPIAPLSRDRDILKMRRAGATRKAIVNALGVADTTVTRALRRHGEELRPNATDYDADAEVAVRRAAGQSISTIAKAMGVDPKMVRRRIKLQELPDPYAGQKRPKPRTVVHPATALYLAERTAGLTTAEIAEKLGTTRRAVYKALARWDKKTADSG